TLAQSLVLGGLALGLGFGSWRTALWLPLAALDGLAWGLLAGALFRTVLTASLACSAFLAGSWLLALLATDSIILPLVKGLMAVVAVHTSRWIFCRDDYSRQLAQARIKLRLPVTLSDDWLVLAWLAFRQGRWVLAACVAASLVLGFVVNGAPL